MRPAAAGRPPPRRRLACRAAGDDEALARVATLSGLPASRVSSLPPALRGRLAANPAGVAGSILSLKAALPGADVAELISRAPGLLDPAACAAAVAAIPSARQLLVADGGGPSENVDALIAAQPLLLTADLDEVVDEIRRLLPGSHPGDVLRRHPQLLLKLQRGSASLGPGAEECSV